MRLHVTYALLAAGIALLASTNIVSAATDAAKNSQIEAPIVIHSPSSRKEIDNAKRFLRATAQTYDGDDNSEERVFATMINGALGKVGSVVETGGAKVVKEVPKLEKYQKWLRAGLNPSQVQSRVNVLSVKKTPLRALSFILRGDDSYQYLKFIVDYNRRQPGSKIPKPASKMQKYELWLYAGLTPSQVRVDVLKKEPWQALRSILRSKDSDQYLKFIVDYKRSQPGSRIPKPASKMQKYELWLHAGLTPTQVRVNILKKAARDVAKHKDARQYAKFNVAYKRRNPSEAVSPF
ncbi:hypothetical protein PC129_g16704 [Phytophthora cactorum]|uniref:RxLR effector protein n=3 Tax=Phytophthora cactorum TaxID=29920 RepID=A0A8T1HIH1_9STRA|nr:hypothetical protein Pcac1_g27718 [Phytophthora cactorum]KAG2797876.1 hypothetical protein PC111_g21096 [Phytophthora cactorum]KAG2852769.1 hypothetical protein PC113_g14745 [Phytophthora cactorum]KAG2887930.1 hypothetical protein PC115_g20187 [Phytophthora cactorum]KAG2971511.1 hypothetical protein PC119_g23375 [Phytophthora cactorum]